MGLARRTLRMVAMLLVAMLVAVACGTGDNDDPDDPDVDVDADDDDDADPDEDADVAAEPDVGGTLRFQDVHARDTLDPDSNTAGNPVNLLFSAYDALIGIDPSTAEFVPGLAEDWERLEDGSVLRLYLREGVTFHDGTDFNADAVVANIERSQAGGHGRDETQQATSAIGDMEVIDEYTVDLIQAEGEVVGWSLIESALAVVSGLMISPQAIEDGVDLDREPVGTGPFVFESFEADRIVYTRNENYWDPDAVQVERLERVFPTGPETHLNALVSGEIDIVLISPDQVAQVEQMDDVDLESVSTLSTYRFAINHSMPPFDDINVRRSLLYGLDREALSAFITDGTAEPTWQMFPPGYFAHSDDFEYSYDPERARELLEESEYWNPDTEQIEPSTNMVVYEAPQHRIRLSEAIQDQMGQLGLQLEFEVFDQAIENPFIEGEEPYSVLVHARSRLDPLEHLVQSLDTEFGVTNPGGFTDDEVDGLLQEAAQLGADERADIVREISGLATDRVYGAIGLYSLTDFWASRCVVGFDLPIATYFDLRGVSIDPDC